MFPLEMAARSDRQVVLHPLFIAAYPVFFLYHANSKAFDFSVVITPLAAGLVLTLPLWWGISRLTRDTKRSAIYTSVLVLGMYSFGPLHEFIGNFSFAQGLEAVSLGTRLVIASFAIVLVSAALCFKLNKHVGGATYVVNIVAVVLVCVPVGETAVLTVQRLQLRQFVPDRSSFEAVPPAILETEDPPDIYFIVLDSYGQSEFLADRYGFDNSRFLSFLADKGFRVTPKSWANYPWTMVSLTSTLNFAYLHEPLGWDLKPFTDRRLMRSLLQQNRTVRNLRAAGYTIVAFDGEYYEADLRDVDRTIGEWWFPNSFQIGYLQMTPLPAVLRQLRWPVLYNLHRDRILYTVEHLPDVAAMPAPKFVFAHIYFGHPPFVFDRQGEAVNRAATYSWEDAPGVGEGEYIRGYNDQVHYLNGKMEAAITRILAESERPPIIILQGDHGPALHTSTVLADMDVRERYSIFNACLFPDGGDENLYDSISPVNTFRVLFNHYFGTDYALLEDRSFYVPFEEIYNFTQISRLESSPQDAQPRIEGP